MSGFGLFLGNYIRRGLQYRWIVLVPAVLAFAVATVYVTMQPDSYESTAVLMRPIANSAGGEIRADVAAIEKTMFRSAAQRMLQGEVLKQIAEDDNPYPRLMDSGGVPAVVEKLRRKIRIDINRATGAIHVTCSHSSGKNPAVTATNIVNKLTTIFVKLQLDALKNQVNDQEVSVSDEKTRLRRDLDRVQQSFDDFKAANAKRLPEDVPTNTARIDRLTSNVADYKTQQRALHDRIDSLRRHNTQLGIQLKSISVETSVSAQLLLRAGRRTLENLNIDLRLLLDQWDENEPSVLALKKRIKYTEESNKKLSTDTGRFDTEERADYVRYQMDETIKSKDLALREIGELDRRIEETATEITVSENDNHEAADNRGVYLAHERAVREAESRHTIIARRHEEAIRRMHLNNAMAPIQVHQAANVPAKPAGPDRLVTSLMGLLLGLGLGVGLAFVRHKLDSSYHRPDDLRALLPGAVLVTVPEIQKRGARLGVVLASVVGGLFLAGIFTVTVAILGVQVGWWGEPEMVHTLIKLR